MDACTVDAVDTGMQWTIVDTGDAVDTVKCSAVDAVDAVDTVVAMQWML